MKRFFIGCFLALVSVSVFFAQTRGGTLIVTASDGSVLTSFSSSHALVIGESAYYQNAGNRLSWKLLPGVKEDVVAVQRLLQDQGFSVTLLEDKTSRELKAGIEDFFNTYGYDSDSRLIVYYAGHGQTLKRERTKTRDMGYIVPIDCPPDAEDERGFMQLAITMDQFNSWAKSIRSRHVLFLFDSCFSGTIFTASRAAPGIIDRSISQPVRQFITSGSEDEEVPDRSIFRRQLEIALRDREADYNKDGYISGSELGQYIQNTVTDAAQSPQYGKISDRDLNKGDFVFAVGLARQEVKIVPPDMGDWDIGSVSIASGSLTINTTTEGHLSITINNTSRDIAYLPDYSTLPIPKISAGNLEVRMVYADGYTENKTVTVEPDKTAEVNFNYRPVPVPDPNLNPDPPGRPPQLGRGPYYSTGKKIGTGFLNLALGLGSFTMGDLGGGLIVAGGYTASAAMIVTEILLMEDGVVGTIGLGVAGAAALFGFIRPFMYDRQLVKQNSAPQFMSRVNAGITPDGRGNATLTFSYTHRF